MKTTLAKVSLAVTLAVSALGLAITSQPASAATFGFDNITGCTPACDTTGDGLTSYLQFDVNTYDATNVTFAFKNLAGNLAGSFIGGIFFDNSGGVLNTPPPTPAILPPTGTVNMTLGTDNFPQGNNLVPDFDTDFSYKKDNDAADGINVGEVFRIVIEGNLSSVITALLNGTLRIGYHLQGINDSDSYVNRRVVEATPTVPLPGAFPLLVGGLGGLAWLGRLRKRSGAASA